MHTDGINYYQRLHVSPIADLVVIKAAYRALMKKYHPDHRDGSTGTAEGLNEAYETLSQPTNRVRYDEGRKKLMFCDEICLDKELLDPAVGAFTAWEELNVS